MKEVVGLIGERRVDYSGRSLRIGGATDLHAAGGDPYVVQLAGRWDSQAHRAYSRATLGQMLKLTHKLQHVGTDAALEDRYKEFTQPARAPGAV